MIAEALHRVQQWAERRLPALTRLRRPENLPIELHRRRIYIVPTRFGLGFGVLLMVMLTGALNYANNAALLLTCLLGAACVTSMLIAYRTLDGLQLLAISNGNAMAGQSIDLTLEFRATRLRSSVRVDLDGQTHAFVVDGDAAVTLSLPTDVRGWQALPRIRVWTTWPMGLFTAWSWLHPDYAMLVWPRPESEGPSPIAPEADARRTRLLHGDDLAALRDYRSGDSPRHIAWKASARHPNLLVKDFEQPQSRQDWQLDWQKLRGMDAEARIARLARWLGEAQAQARRCSLRLPDETINSGSGAAHYARCMDALAKLP